MATIAARPIDSGHHRRLFSWDNVTGADTCALVFPESTFPLGGSVQFSGTFGAAITLQGSNDGVAWFDLKDQGGTTISATAAAFFEFSTSAAYLRANPASGVGGVTVTVCLRG